MFIRRVAVSKLRRRIEAFPQNSHSGFAAVPSIRSIRKSAGHSKVLLEILALSINRSDRSTAVVGRSGTSQSAPE
jgi:hypothetical protein